MKSPQKMSRNQRRKAAYSAQADKGSRNQEQIAAPIVGRLEMVTHETVTTVRNGEIIDLVRPIQPYQRVVHDQIEQKTETVQKPAKRETDARKRRRQEAAWARCKTKSETGSHSDNTNCHSCGCPVDKAA